MKKKVLAMVMAGILAAGSLLAGCGSKDEQKTGADAKGQSAEKTESGYAKDAKLKVWGGVSGRSGYVQKADRDV